MRAKANKQTQSFVLQPLDIAEIIVDGKAKPGSGRCHGPRDLDHGPRPWQGRRYRHLVDARLRRVVGPPAAGKSTVARALMLHDVYDDGKKAIVSFPNRSIAASFGRVAIKLPGPGGRVLTWVPPKSDKLGNPLVARVQEIKEFLLSPAAADPNGRILLCTHAALVRADKELAGRYPDKNLSLVIDEVQFSRADRKNGVTNMLGQIVRRMIEHGSGQLTLVTAMWGRTVGDIIPPEYRDRFACDPYHIDQYFEDHFTGRVTIRVRFHIGRQVETFSQIIRADPHRKTLSYLPLGLDPDKKERLVRKCQTAIGRLHLDVSDLVTKDQNRSGSEATLLKRIREEIEAGEKGRSRPEMTPDLVFALKKFCVGSDWPPASRIVMLEARASLLNMGQIFGRTFRVWRGKRDIEINIILPTVQASGTVEIANIEGYLKAILAALVMEMPFRRVAPLGSGRRQKRAAMLAEEILRGEAVGLLPAGLVGAAIANDGKADAIAVAEERLFDELSKTHPDLGDPLVRAHVKHAVHAQARDTARRLVRGFFERPQGRTIARKGAELPFHLRMEQEILKNPIAGLLTVVVHRCGYATFKEIRLALSRKISFRSFEDARFLVHTLRLSSTKEWHLYCQSGRKPSDIPSCPWVTYETQFKSMGDWLGTGRIANQYKVLASCARTGCKKRATPGSTSRQRTGGIKAYCEVHKWGRHRIKLLPCGMSGCSMRATRNSSRNSKWNGSKPYCAKHKHGVVAVGPIPCTINECTALCTRPRLRECRPYCDKHKWGRSVIIWPFRKARGFVRDQKLDGVKAWAQWSKHVRPAFIPSDPARKYAGKGWAGMGDWLGTGNIQNGQKVFLSFVAARQIARQLKWHKPTRSEWQRLKSNRPKKIPANPDTFYKDEGWTGWGDWYGTGRLGER